MSAKVERLVNLTIALLESPAPLSLAELRRRTGYYTDGASGSTRRMFERDKDELRALGVPIETASLPFSEEIGYTIARRDYELPDVHLDADEVAALALAVRLTGTDGTPLALAKLAARAPDPAPLMDPADTRIEVRADPVDEVADAVVQRIAVTFSYRAADGTQRRRTVDPYGVVQRRAAWYLVGHDHDRDALRAFRFDRFVDRPRPVGPPGSYQVPEDLDVAAAVAGQELAGVAVTLAVAPQARWAVELRGGRDTGRTHDGRPVLELTGLHPVRDRAWVLGLGGDVEVLGPPELRDAVRDGLDAVLAAHAPRADADEDDIEGPGTDEPGTDEPGGSP